MSSQCTVVKLFAIFGNYCGIFDIKILFTLQESSNLISFGISPNEYTLNFIRVGTNSKYFSHFISLIDKMKT